MATHIPHDLIDRFAGADAPDGMVRWLRERPRTWRDLAREHPEWLLWAAWKFDDVVAAVGLRAIARAAMRVGRPALEYVRHILPELVAYRCTLGWQPEDGEVIRGRDGRLVIDPFMRGKLMIPDRSQPIPEELLGHRVTATELVHDTMPEELWRGVLFVRWEHSNKCWTCTLERDRKNMEKLVRAVGADCTPDEFLYDLDFAGDGPRCSIVQPWLSKALAPPNRIHPSRDWDTLFGNIDAVRRIWRAAHEFREELSDLAAARAKAAREKKETWKRFCRVIDRCERAVVREEVVWQDGGLRRLRWWHPEVGLEVIEQEQREESWYSTGNSTRAEGYRSCWVWKRIGTVEPTDDDIAWAKKCEERYNSTVRAEYEHAMGHVRATREAYEKAARAYEEAAGKAYARLVKKYKIDELRGREPPKAGAAERGRDRQS